MTTSAEMQQRVLDVAENLRTQDNRITDQPMFVVQQKRYVVGLNLSFGASVCWVRSDDGLTITTGVQFAELEASYRETAAVPDGWHRTGFHAYWENVTFCFTEKGCEDYIKRDGHNLVEPRIYAAGSFRNEEFRLLRDFLLGVDVADLDRLVAPEVAA